MVTNKKVADVTRSSSGINFETSLILARKGFETLATMRNIERYSLKIIYRKRKYQQKNNQTQHYLCDTLAKEIIRNIYNDSKRIDILVNNAG